jgi:hypothetical protein
VRRYGGRRVARGVNFFNHKQKEDCKVVKRIKLSYRESLSILEDFNIFGKILIFPLSITIFPVMFFAIAKFSEDELNLK